MSFQNKGSDIGESGAFLDERDQLNSSTETTGGKRK